MKKRTRRKPSKPEETPVKAEPQEAPAWAKPAYIEWHRLNCAVLSVHTALLERVRQYHLMNPTTPSETK